MNELLNIVTAAFAYGQEHWGAILALTGGGLGLSGMLEWLLVKLHVDSKKIAYTLLHLFSFLTALVALLPANLPLGDLAPIYASLAILAQTWHRFVISPFYNNKLAPFLEDVAAVRAARTPTVSAIPEPQPNQFV